MSTSDRPMTAVEVSVIDTFEESLNKESLADNVIQLVQDTYRLEKLPNAQSFLNAIKDETEATLQ